MTMPSGQSAWTFNSVLAIAMSSASVLTGLLMDGSLQIILLAEVVADLHQHRDAFGVAGFCDRRRLGVRAEFPALAVREHRDDDAIRAIGMDLQFGPRHRNEFGFGLDGLAHGRLPPDHIAC